MKNFLGAVLIINSANAEIGGAAFDPSTRRLCPEGCEVVVYDRRGNEGLEKIGGGRVKIRAGGQEQKKRLVIVR